MPRPLEVQVTCSQRPTGASTARGQALGGAERVKSQAPKTGGLSEANRRSGGWGTEGLVVGELQGLVAG